MSTNDYLSFDVVFCVEATSEMANYRDEINDFILKSFKNKIEESVEDCNESAETNLRVRFIHFNDVATSPHPFICSEFMKYDHNVVEEYLKTIDYKGGYGYCNAIEALSLAIRSPWDKGNMTKRAIVIVSKGKVRELGGVQKNQTEYPSNVPKDLAELGRIWEGIETDTESSYFPAHSIIFAIVSKTYPWVELQAWNRYWPEFEIWGGINERDNLSHLHTVVANALFDGSF